MVDFSNVARECGVSSHTAKSYFGILEDTLLARWLPSYRKCPNRRVIRAPKFCFADVGVVNLLARRGEIRPRSELHGKAFENRVFHELTAFASYRGYEGAMTYWRLAGGTEVDFVLGDMELAVEAKSSAKITSDHLKGLPSLVEDHPRVQRRVVVCREPKARSTSDGIHVLPALTFIRKLWDGALT